MPGNPENPMPTSASISSNGDDDDWPSLDMKNIESMMRECDATDLDDIANLIHAAKMSCYQGIIVEVDDCSKHDLAAHLMTVAASLLRDDDQFVEHTDQGDPIMRTRDGASYRLMPV